MKFNNSQLLRFAAIGGLTVLVGGITIAANADSSPAPTPNVAQSQPVSVTPIAPVTSVDSVASTPSPRPTISAIPGMESDDQSGSSADQATDDSTDQATDDATDQATDDATDQASTSGDNADSNSQSNSDLQNGESD